MGVRPCTTRNRAAPALLPSPRSAPGQYRDPMALLKASNQDRLPELIPIRYGRMLPSPFTFLRGIWFSISTISMKPTPLPGSGISSGW